MSEEDRKFIEHMERFAKAIKVWTAILCLIVLSLDDIHQTLIRIIRYFE